MTKAPITIEQARKAKKKIILALKSVPGVRGVGICRVGKGYGVKVYFFESESAIAKAMKDEFNGVPLVIAVVGTIRALKKGSISKK